MTIDPTLNAPAAPSPAAGLTQEELERVLAELAAHESDCAASPDPEEWDAETWRGSLMSLGAGQAYAHAARIIRQAVSA